MVVSAALATMLTLSGMLVAPDGCRVVAAWEDGRAVAACADPHTWFEFTPDLTRDGMWTIAHVEPPGLSGPKREPLQQRTPFARWIEGEHS